MTRPCRGRLVRLLVFFVMVAAPAAAEQKGHHHGDNLRGRSPDSYMKMLERDERDAYQKPEEVVEALALAPGDDVADIGAGSGYFTRRVAETVGSEGTVYALDIEDAFLARIAEDAGRLGLDNIRTVKTPPERPALEDGSVDMVLVVNTWHHIPDRRSYVVPLRRALRQGGRLVHIDWVKAKTPTGPPMDHRISRDEVVEEMSAAGFRLRSEHFFLPYQYFLVFDVEPEEAAH